MLKTNKLHKPERNAELVAMREAGQTFTDIARHFGISVHRCTSIYAIAMKKRRGHDSPARLHYVAENGVASVPDAIRAPETAQVPDRTSLTST
jgi:hypothetical protein